MPGTLNELLAAIARREVEQHENWDRPSGFEILVRADGTVVPRVHLCLMPDITPSQYPRYMHRAAGKWLRDHPEEPPYAFLLTFEGGYSAEEPDPDAPREAHDEYWAAARRPCGFRDLPYHREEFAAWVVDVHGPAMT